MSFLKRFEQNPILTPETMPFECYAVFNAGAVKFRDEYLLLLRVEDLSRISNFYLARSKNGIDFQVDLEPINYPMSVFEIKQKAVRFDARITQIGNVYYLTHAVWLDSYGSVSAIGRTTDFVHFEAVGTVSVPSNRNTVLFSEKFNGRYARLERPQNIDGSGSIWVSYSPDLIHWGDSIALDMPRLWWGTRKCGAGIPPIKTQSGWLTVYHATMMTASSENYFLGVMLLDLNKPWKIIAAPEKFILAAQKDYECIGNVPNVVFTCGAIECNDGALNVYYGGADTRMCLAQTTVNELVDFCLEAKNK